MDDDHLKSLLNGIIMFKTCNHFQLGMLID